MKNKKATTTITVTVMIKVIMSGGKKIKRNITLIISIIKKVPHRFGYLKKKN